MKNKKLFWTLFIIVISALLTALLVFTILYWVQNDVQVFDLTNFVSAFIFSAISIIISLHELSVTKQMEIAKANIQNDISSSLKQHFLKVKNIEQLYKDFYDKYICGDFPTYTNCNLEEMCKLFETFHQPDTSSVGKRNPQKEVSEIIEAYIKAVEESSALIISKGAYLPHSVIAIAISICDDINEINTDLIRFNQLAGINYWTILTITGNDSSFYGQTELERRQHLYSESTKLYALFEELLAKVISNYKRFEMLLAAINEK